MTSSTMPSKLPRDAVWFITGTSTGIGNALIHHLLNAPASYSYRVVALSRNPSTIPLPPSSNSTNTLLVPVDLTSEDSISAAFDAAVAKFGRIDVVVNNAGYGLWGEFESVSIASSKALFEINYWAPVLITRHALRVFREVNPTTGPIGGTVVQVTSVGGVLAVAGGSAYHASKWALEGFTESVSKEVDPDWGIRFVVFEPGSVKTEWAGANMQRGDEQHPAYVGKKLGTEVMAEMRDQIGDKIGADPAKVAEVMATVLEDEQRQWRDGNGPWGNLLRMVLNAEAYHLLRKHLQDDLETREKFKEISESTSPEGYQELLKNM